MSPAAIGAFNQASGTTVDETRFLILGVLLVAVFLWAAVMFWGKLVTFRTQRGIDGVHLMWSILRALAVVIVVLFLVNI